MRGSKYLSELITDPASILPGKMNLIEANTSAGKTYFALNTLPQWAGTPEKVLYLIDTINGELRLRQNIVTISRLEYELTNYGEKEGWGEPIACATDKMPVMTYAGFGAEIKNAASPFWEKFEYIVCDEIQNLVNYQKMNGSRENLERAERTLMEIAREGKTKIIALSATPQKAREHFGDLCWNVPFDKESLIFYETASTETYASVQSLLLQVGGKTGILYTERIESMKKLISFAREQGIRADGFWSIREEAQAKHPMSEEQFALQKAVLEQETIPENIDLLVINAASETCIKIQGEKRKVDYMIIHHTNEETQTQVRGRYCGDLPKLYLHSTTLNPMVIVVPTDFLGRKLFPEDKEALCRTLNLANPKGGYYKWRKVCSLLEESNYSVEMGRENYKRYAIIRSKPRDSD